MGRERERERKTTIRVNNDKYFINIRTQKYVANGVSLYGFYENVGGEAKK